MKASGRISIDTWFDIVCNEQAPVKPRIYTQHYFRLKTMSAGLNI
jgi:hypothetical protein